MALVRPSVILQFMLQPEDYSEHVVRELKRSYMHIAQSMAGPADEAHAADGNVMRLRIRLLKPYWDTADPQACELWDGVMPRWLRNIVRNLTTVMRTYNSVMHPFGIGRVYFDWVDFEFDDNALLRVKTEHNGITPELPALVAHARDLMGAGAFGEGEVALIRMPSLASLEAQRQAAGPSEDLAGAGEAADEAPAADAADAEAGLAADPAADEAPSAEPADAADEAPEAPDEPDEPVPATPSAYDYRMWDVVYADGTAVEFDAFSA